LLPSGKRFRIRKHYATSEIMKRVISALRSLNTVPPDDNEFANWLELTDAVQFLKENAEDDEFVLFAQSASFTFIR
jgi:hypothetical protein